LKKKISIFIISTTPLESPCFLLVRSCPRCSRSLAAVRVQSYWNGWTCRRRHRWCLYRSAAKRFCREIKSSSWRLAWRRAGCRSSSCCVLRSSRMATETIPGSSFQTDLILEPGTSRPGLGAAGADPLAPSRGWVSEPSRVELLHGGTELWITSHPPPHKA